MNRREKEWRFSQLKEMGCLTCPGCGPVEIHHLNLGGHAGMPRRGDEYTLPLGSWAHRGEPLPGYTARQMEVMFGPSLARNSKAFRARYGDDDYLLAIVNLRLESRRKLRVA